MSKPIRRTARPKKMPKLDYPRWCVMTDRLRDVRVIKVTVEPTDIYSPWSNTVSCVVDEQRAESK